MVKNNDDTDITKNDSIDLDDGLIQVEKEQRCIYYINIDTEIVEAQAYRNVFKILRNANLEDIVILILNTPGGLVTTTMQIYNYLLTTNATTIAEIHTAYSGGSLLALACDNIQVAKFGSMMLHSLSSSPFGKIHELEGQVTFFNQFNDKAFKELYVGFLNPQEIKAILDGKDMWLMEDEIIRRLKNWKPIRQRIMESEQEKQNKEISKKKKI